MIFADIFFLCLSVSGLPREDLKPYLIHDASRLPTISSQKLKFVNTSLPVNISPVCTTTVKMHFLCDNPALLVFKR